jgi:hypothetical protein
MKANRLVLGIMAAAVLAALPACGKRFPFGEKLLPETYGPPFGAEVSRNLPKHPHYPAGEERHALVDSSAAKTYKSHAACHAALETAVRAHGASGKVVRISAIESLGSYRVGAQVHEHRCSDYTLTHRSWCQAGESGGHGGAHKKAPNQADACKDSDAHH